MIMGIAVNKLINGLSAGGHQVGFETQKSCHKMRNADREFHDSVCRESISH